MPKPRDTIAAELLITPDPGVTRECILVARDPKAAGLGFYFSRDGGATFQVMIPAPDKNTRPGSVLTIDDKGNAVWALPPPAAPVPLSPNRQYVSFNLVGDLSVGAVFGLFKVLAGHNAVLKEITLAMQDVADDDVTIDVVNSSGVVQNRTATIGAGSLNSTTILNVPLAMAARSTWRMRVIGCGSSAPGQNLCVLAGIEFTS